MKETIRILYQPESNDISLICPKPRPASSVPLSFAPQTGHAYPGPTGPAQLSIALRDSAGSYSPHQNQKKKSEGEDENIIPAQRQKAW